MLGVIGIVIAVALLIFLGFKGYNLVLVTMLCSVVVMAFNGLPIFSTFTGTFMSQFGIMMGAMLPMMAFGAILGQLYAVSGAAMSVGKLVLKGAGRFKGEKQIVVIVTLVCIVTFVMTAYGGISALVQMYLLAPIVISICQFLDIPRRFIPMLFFICPMALVIPGSTQMYNTVPQQALGTMSTSCFIPGVIASVLVTIGNIILGYYLIVRAKKKGESFDSHPSDPALEEEGQHLPIILALLPLILVCVIFNVFHLDIVIALVAGIVLAIILFTKWIGSWKKVTEALGTGATNGALAHIGFCGLMGFAAVVTSTPAFATLQNAISNWDGDPILLTVVSVALVTGMTNSAETGSLTVIGVFGDLFMSRGMTPALLHRLATLTGATLDTLPTNPGVHIALGISHTSMKKSYFPIFLHTVLMPTVGVIIFVILIKLVPAWGLI